MQVIGKMQYKKKLTGKLCHLWIPTSSQIHNGNDKKENSCFILALPQMQSSPSHVLMLFIITVLLLFS